MQSPKWEQGVHDRQSRLMLRAALPNSRHHILFSNAASTLSLQGALRGLASLGASLVPACSVTVASLAWHPQLTRPALPAQRPPPAPLPQAQACLWLWQVAARRLGLDAIMMDTSSHFNQIQVTHHLPSITQQSAASPDGRWRLQLAPPVLRCSLLVVCNHRCQVRCHCQLRQRRRRCRSSSITATTTNNIKHPRHHRRHRHRLLLLQPSHLPRPSKVACLRMLLYRKLCQKAAEESRWTRRAPSVLMTSTPRGLCQ